MILARGKTSYQQPPLPHNLTMSFTGAAMLWVGWFGFNAGSALAADGAAGMALFQTHISASVGALTWIIIEWLKYGKPSGLGAITGMVAGLATITPASGSVGPAGALLVGLSGGVICYYATAYLKQGLKIDDFRCLSCARRGRDRRHLPGGHSGISRSRHFFRQRPSRGATIGSQVGVQVTGIIATGVYTAILTVVLPKLVAALTGAAR